MKLVEFNFLSNYFKIKYSHFYYKLSRFTFQVKLSFVCYVYLYFAFYVVVFFVYACLFSWQLADVFIVEWRQPNCKKCNLGRGKNGMANGDAPSTDVQSKEEICTCDHGEYCLVSWLLVDFTFKFYIWCISLLLYYLDHFFQLVFVVELTTCYYFVSVQF